MLSGSCLDRQGRVEAVGASRRGRLIQQEAGPAPSGGVGSSEGDSQRLPEELITSKGVVQNRRIGGGRCGVLPGEPLEPCPSLLVLHDGRPAGEELHGNLGYGHLRRRHRLRRARSLLHAASSGLGARLPPGSGDEE